MLTSLHQFDDAHLIPILHGVSDNEMKQGVFYMIVDTLITNCNLPLLRYCKQNFFNEWSFNLSTISAAGESTGLPSLFWTAWWLYDDSTSEFEKAQHLAVFMHLLNDTTMTFRADELEGIRVRLEKSPDANLEILRRVNDELSTLIQNKN